MIKTMISYILLGITLILYVLNIFPAMILPDALTGIIYSTIGYEPLLSPNRPLDQAITLALESFAQMAIFSGLGVLCFLLAIVIDPSNAITGKFEGLKSFLRIQD
ncbi:MAG: hypothetical protein ACXADA_17630 [Candidatus Hodarchaeales archaeon]|jgi:hypothetical protein